MATKGKWQDRTELVVALSVVVSLVVLIVEVRTNTRAIERQSRIQYIESMTQPYIDGASIGEVLAKIKAVDRREPTVAALMDAYALTDVEAAAWHRWLARLWQGMDADFQYGGRELVEEAVRLLLPYRDAEIYWETMRDWHSPEFRALVDEIRAESANLR